MSTISKAGVAGYSLHKQVKEKQVMKTVKLVGEIQSMLRSFVSFVLPSCSISLFLYKIEVT